MKTWKNTQHLLLKNPGLSSFLISIFLHFPPLHVYLNYTLSSDRFGLMMQQAINPFNISYDTIDNVLAYRIIVPLVNHLVGIRGHAIVIPSILGSLLLCMIAAKIFRDRCDGLTAFLLTLSVALSYLVVSGTCFWAATDSLAFFLVLSIMLCKNRYLSWLLVFLAISVDERSIVSIALLPILDSIYSSRALANTQYTMEKYASYAPGVFLAFLLVVIISTGIIFPAPVEHYQYKAIERELASGSAFSLIRILYDLTQWLFGLKWLWLFPVISAMMTAFPKKGALDIHLTTHKVSQNKAFALMLGLVIISIYFIASLAAGDQWRCVLYIFPVIIASALYLYDHYPDVSRITCRWVAFLSVLTPQFFLGSYSGWETSIQTYWPMPLVIVKQFTLHGA